VPWKLHRATALDPSSRVPIDDVLAVWMPAPRTYTGEDVVEIHCHGSPIVVDALIAAGTRAGLRCAERGEFTRRAVLNGRMDLVQAEAVADLIDARFRGGARLAWEQLQGGLSRRLAGLRERLLGVLSDIEANVDFSDDDLEQEEPLPRLDALDAAATEMTELLDGFVASRRWRDGYRVVFTGAPNVGKSSLVNALLGHTRMIVSEEAGTTCDCVEEEVDLDGYAFVLTDTAGVRETVSRAETLAVEGTRQVLQRADIVVHVLDASAPSADGDRTVPAVPEGVGYIVVLNKWDLAQRDNPTGSVAAGLVRAHACVATCALTGYGCDALAAALAAFASSARVDADQASTGISRTRHRSSLERARASVRSAAELLRSDHGPELASIELRTALEELASVTEPTGTEDVLDRIFKDFCIGK
jgi:tRNA modification GTPase